VQHVFNKTKNTMIKNLGGVFGRNPTFNNVEVGGDLTVDGSIIGTVAAGGSNTQVQFNNAGVLDANAGLTYDSATETLRVRSHPTRYLTIGPDGAGASEILAYGNTALVLNSVESTVDIGDIGVIANGTAIQIDDPNELLNINCPNGTITVDSPTVTLTGTTASTSSTTGALIVAGGAGIAKDSFINTVRVGLGAAGTNNTTLGASTGTQLTAGSAGCTMVGYQSGFWNSSGNGNTSVGQNCLLNTRTGSWSSALGINAIYTNQSGSHNVSVGLEGLYNVTGDNNTGIGSNSGYHLAGASTNNICIGYIAGKFQADGTTALTTSSNSCYIGTGSRGLNNSDSNSIVIGSSAIGIGANKTVIGTSSTTETKLFGTLTLDNTALISAPSATALAIKSVVPAGTGVTPTIQVICPSSATALTSGATAQNVFSPVGFDTITVQASTTYMFDGLYIIKTTGATTHTISMSFALTTATITNCTWTTMSYPLASTPTSAVRAQDGNFFAAVGGGAVNATNATAFNVVKFEGIMRVNAGGSVVPQITFSAAPGGTNTLEIGSYLRFYPIGSNTIDNVGTAIG